MKSENDDLLADIGRLHASLRRRFDRALTEQGLSLARTKMLMLIQAEGGAARAADIADKFGVAPRTVTEALDGLERDGLIARVPDPVDRRTKRLQMTPAGEAAVRVTEPLRRKLAQETFDMLDAREQAIFHATIRKVLGGASPS
jgi:DNA-binding MarR family transcriptional regulator